MDRFVRITLEEQYRNHAGEELDVVGLRFGSEPAQQVGSYAEDPLTGAAVPVSERAMIGAERGGMPAKFVPGRPIVYEMRWSDPDQRQAVVPDYVAIHYFGDWKLTPGSGFSSEASHPAEKRRVASIWGNYVKEPRDVMQPNHWRNLRKIAPPCVPRVVIHRLDSAYREIPGFAYRPWESFQWEKDCVQLTPSHQAQHAPRGLVDANGVPLDLSATIQALVAEQVALALAKPSLKKVA